jgi:hypothetical protein
MGAVVPDRNFVFRTLFAVLRHICNYSYFRQKSLLKLVNCLYIHQRCVSYTARTKQRLLAKYTFIVVYQYRQHRHKS